LIVGNRAARDADRATGNVDAAALAVSRTLSGATILASTSIAAGDAGATDGLVRRYRAVAQSQRGAVRVDTAAVGILARRSLGHVAGHRDVIEQDVAAVVENAAAQGSRAAHAAAIRRQTARDRQITEDHGDVADDLKGTIHAVGIDDGQAGARASNGLGEAGGRQVQITGLPDGLHGPRNRQVVGAGGQLDGVVLAIGVGLDDGITEGADAQTIGKDGGLDNGWHAAVFQLLDLEGGAGLPGRAAVLSSPPR
jgi:hypothetical protein